MPIAIAVLFAALSVAVLLLIVTAAGLAAATKKPHYARLASQWARALAIMLAIAVLHVVAVEVVTRRAGQHGVLVAVVESALGRGTYGHLVAACVAVGLVTTAAYARALLRFADDYAARTGFRIGAALALLGLVFAPPALGPGLPMLAGSLLVAALGFLAISWLWHHYAREPAWLLRTVVAASPLGLLALFASASRSLPTLQPPLTAGGRETLIQVDTALIILAAVLLVRLARRRGPDVRSLEAQLDDARRARRTRGATSPISMGVPRNAGR